MRPQRIALAMWCGSVAARPSPAAAIRRASGHLPSFVAPSSSLCNANRRIPSHHAWCGVTSRRFDVPLPRLPSISRQPTRFSSNINELVSDDVLSDLRTLIDEAYQSGETDGVQEAILSTGMVSKLSATLDADAVGARLVEAAMDAAGKDRGKLAGTINAILASCCGDEEDGSPSQPQIVLAALDKVDELQAADAETMVAPDIVSLSLVYYALCDNQEFAAESQAILERAQRIAKKSAGSQRRKELAAERRKDIQVDAKEAESHLRSLYGPDIGVLHDDDDMIMVSKPAGMVCYHTKKTSAGKLTSSRKKKSRAANKTSGGTDDAKQMDISLVDALLDVPISLSTLNPSARGIVHRLDRGTSGSIVLAKTDEAHLKLVALFFLRRVKKKYLALVPGRDVRTDAEDNITSPSLTVESTGMVNVQVDGRSARSTYKVVGEYGKQSAISDALLLEVETLSGRKHQVRVHCSVGLGRPIFLDSLYSYHAMEKKPKAAEKGKKKRAKTNANAVKGTGTVESATNQLPTAISDLLEHQQRERFFLHAKSLAIPEFGIEVEAPLPSWWIDTLDQLESGSVLSLI